MAGHEVPRGRERSAQAALLEQLGFPVANDRSADSGNSNGGGKDAVQTALASMDAATRAQLLSALLNLKQQATGNSPAASNPSPRPVAAVNSPRPLSHPSPRDLNHSPYQSQSSPRAFSNGGGSQHDSPQSFYGPATPHPLQQQHPVSMSAPMNNPFQPHPAALTTSLPPSLVSSPAQSPYIHAQAFYPTSQSNLPPQSLPQAQMNALSFQNAFSSPRPFDQQQQQHQQQQQQLHQQQQQQMSELQSQQLAMEMIARVGGMNPTSHDMNLRGGSATGGSYATNPDRDPSWGENEVRDFAVLITCFSLAHAFRLPFTVHVQSTHVTRLVQLHPRFLPPSLRVGPPLQQHSRLSRRILLPSRFSRHHATTIRERGSHRLATTATVAAAQSPRSRRSNSCARVRQCQLCRSTSPWTTLSSFAQHVRSTEWHVASIGTQRRWFEHRCW